MRSKQRKTYTPKLCITVAASTIPELSSKLGSARRYNPEFVELRIDYLKENLGSKERSRISKLFDGREILTMRSKNQGGRFNGSEDHRIEVMRDFLEECSPKCIDVELSTLAKNSDVLNSVLKKTKVIASTHFFGRTPTHSELERIASSAPDFIYALKIVCFARTFRDNLNLLSLYDYRIPIRLIAFCMGPLGIFSRIACASLGSPLTYASLPGEAVAPGQLDAQTMSSLLSNL